MPIPIPSLASILDLLKGAITIEAREKIMQLREAALELQAENLQLREGLREAERKLELRALFFDRGVLWKDNPPGPPDGPYCQPCCDLHGKLVRLHDQANPYGGSQSQRVWYCYGCRNTFHQKPILKTEHPHQEVKPMANNRFIFYDLSGRPVRPQPYPPTDDPPPAIYNDLHHFGTIYLLDVPDAEGRCVYRQQP